MCSKLRRERNSLRKKLDNTRADLQAARIEAANWKVEYQRLRVLVLRALKRSEEERQLMRIVMKSSPVALGDE